MGPRKVKVKVGMDKLPGYLLPYLAEAYTRAKSCDHAIVRAQKKVSKGRPNTPPNSCSVVTDPQA
jgi:hypothetical protein